MEIKLDLRFGDRRSDAVAVHPVEQVEQTERMKPVEISITGTEETVRMFFLAASVLGENKLTRYSLAMSICDKNKMSVSHREEDTEAADLLYQFATTAITIDNILKSKRVEDPGQRYGVIYNTLSKLANGINSGI